MGGWKQWAIFTVMLGFNEPTGAWRVHLSSKRERTPQKFGRKLVSKWQLFHSPSLTRTQRQLSIIMNISFSYFWKRSVPFVRLLLCIPTRSASLCGGKTQICEVHGYDKEWWWRRSKTEKAGDSHQQTQICTDWTTWQSKSDFSGKVAQSEAFAAQRGQRALDENSHVVNLSAPLESCPDCVIHKDTELALVILAFSSGSYTIFKFSGWFTF